jgi:hypothetical protein
VLGHDGLSYAPHSQPGEAPADPEPFLRRGTTRGGTALHPGSASSSAPKPQFWRGKPLVALNTVANRHALRQWGIDDKVQGVGRLLADL